MPAWPHLFKVFSFEREAVVLEGSSNFCDAQFGIIYRLRPT